MTISEAIKGITFSHMEGIDCSKILKIRSDYIEWGGARNPMIDLFKVGVITFLYQYYFSYVEKKENAKTLFIISREATGRKDHVELMRRVYSCAERNSSLIIQKKYKRPHFYGPKTAIVNVKDTIKWYRELKGAHLSFASKLFVVGTISMAKAQMRALSSFLSYNNYVVLFDAGEADNITVQYFKLHGKKTITLQHGVIYSRRKVRFGGVEFDNSVADFFLASNEITRQEAIKDGYDVSKMIICGNCRCLDLPVLKKNNNKIIGVLLDGEELHNKDLIILANEYCKKYGYKYVLKYHPFYKGNEYDSLVDKDYYLGNNNELIGDYAQKVEFTIMGISAALLELVYMQHDTYVYSSNDVMDFYYQYIPTMHDLASLEQLIEDPEYKKKAYDKLVSVSNIRGAYTKFFENL